MRPHQIIVCSCGRVIAQCRCMAPKTTVTRPHPACEQAMFGAKQRGDR